MISPYDVLQYRMSPMHSSSTTSSLSGELMHVEHFSFFRGSSVPSSNVCGLVDVVGHDTWG